MGDPNSANNHPTMDNQYFVSPSYIGQTNALLIRHFRRSLRFKNISVIKIFLVPVISILLMWYYSDQLKEMKNTKPHPTFIALCAWLPLVWHVKSQCDINIIDKDSQFKSLMYTMGLSRFPYYLSNLINYLAYTLPTIATLCYVQCYYSFDKTPIYWTISIIILFNIQLWCLLFLLTSPLTSTKFSLLPFSLYLLETAYSIGVLRLAEKVKDSIFARAYVFVTSFSPFQALRIFADSWVPDGQSQEFKIYVINDEVVIRETNLQIVCYILIWIFTLFGLGAWMEEICPWKTDTEIKDCFFCFPSCRKRKQGHVTAGDLSLEGSQYFEKNPATRSTGLRLFGLSKSFNSKPAVSNLTMRIFRGETTLLLGHNGSGKTTLMNMILGQLNPDQGWVEKYHSRTGIGVCPQNSIVDQNLTVEQHLRLLISIKGYLATDRTYRVDDLINQTLLDIGLMEKRNNVPSELSGGMLRKLSLGMALVGESDILILDEPSSGLDPDSRVFIWNAIRRLRTNKTVLLSSQHMEEADFLGDRIGIMSEGQLVSCGSSLFLKRLFGTGYRLLVECQTSNVQRALNRIRLYFPRAAMSEDDFVAQRNLNDLDPIVSLIIRLSGNSSDEFRESNHKNEEEKLIKLLEYLESDTSLIKSHGVRASSIEDVLLNTNRYFKTAKTLTTNNQQVELQLDTIENKIDSILTVSQYNSPSLMKLTYALTIKNLYNFRYNKASMLMTRLIIPIIAMYFCTKSVDEEYPGLVFGYEFFAMLETAQLSLIICALANYPCRERLSKFKSMLLASKANYYLYWLSHLISDVISSSIIIIILLNTYLYFFVKNQPQYVSIYVIHLILTAAVPLFMISGSLLAYILSKMFNDAESSDTKTLLLLNLNNMINTLLAIVKLVTKFSQPHKSIVDEIHNILGTIFVILLPTESYAYILYGLRSDGYFIKPGDEFKNLISPILLGFGCLVAQIIFYACCLLALESSNISISGCLNVKYLYLTIKNLFDSSEETLATIPDDDDVMRETAKASLLIKESSPKPDKLVMVADDLVKSYVPGRPVVNHLSLTIDRAECFGLLGVNGAGKTTTFGMLTAETNPNDGRIWLRGVYNNNLNMYRPLISYDPQVNADISMTPVEALYLMARLRLVKEESISRLVQDLLQVLDMSEHAYKSMKTLSGGTKRKLTLAMSLVGNPTCLALDEPTAGVDPIARRKIWLLLRTLRTKNNVSVIISSHAMEECEAICDRISIMSRGKLRCLGTFLHLQSKFAVGCTVRISLTNHEIEIDKNVMKVIVGDLKIRLDSAFDSSVKLEDINENSAVFTIGRNLKRSKLFKIMREFVAKYNNIHYLINDTSLEDVFKMIANENENIPTN